MKNIPRKIPMALYIFDTEFQESGNKSPIIPISIGIVKVDFETIQNNPKAKVPIKTYYAVSNEFDENQLSDWLKENVIPTLNKKPNERKSLEQIKNDILEFVGEDNNPTFMAYYADYDWVVFCQLFGSMIDLPEHFPMFCLDLKQLLNQFGNPKMPEQEGQEHNALDDAIHNTKNFLKLYNMVKEKNYKGSDLFKF